MWSHFNFIAFAVLLEKDLFSLPTDLCHWFDCGPLTSAGADIATSSGDLTINVPSSKGHWLCKCWRVPLCNSGEWTADWSVIVLQMLFVVVIVCAAAAITTYICSCGLCPVHRAVWFYAAAAEVNAHDVTMRYGRPSFPGRTDRLTDQNQMHVLELVWF